VWRLPPHILHLFLLVSSLLSVAQLIFTRCVLSMPHLLVCALLTLSIFRNIEFHRHCCSAISLVLCQYFGFLRVCTLYCLVIRRHLISCQIKSAEIISRNAVYEQIQGFTILYLRRRYSMEIKLESCSKGNCIIKRNFGKKTLIKIKE
jgi:hypothetical protein